MLIIFDYFDFDVVFVFIDKFSFNEINAFAHAKVPLETIEEIVDNIKKISWLEKMLKYRN